MSRYHRSKQGRSHGAYRKRLLARGLNNAPRMTPYRNADPKLDRTREAKT